MANRNFNRKQALEKEVKELFAEITPAVVTVAATATLNLSTDIILTSVATGAARNTTTFELVVEAPAANPTDEVLVAFTGTAAAIVCTVTPNDGTNNAATPVDLDEDELVELINTGAVVGKTITLTDASSRRVLQTATGGQADALTAADDQSVSFLGGVTAVASSFVSAVGCASISRDDVGEYTLTLSDKYYALKGVSALVKHSSAVDIRMQLKSEDVDGAKTIVFLLLTGATPTDLSASAKLMLKLELKNSTV